MAHVQYISFKHRLQDNQLENFLKVFVLVVESIAIKMGRVGGGGGVIHIFTCKKIKAMFTLYWISFAPARK